MFHVRFATTRGWDARIANVARRVQELLERRRRDLANWPVLPFPVESVMPAEDHPHPAPGDRINFANGSSMVVVRTEGSGPDRIVANVQLLLPVEHIEINLVID